jgi:hypothetical protein
MSTENECKYYNQCGFVSFRKNSENNDLAIPLPSDGNCGIDKESCLRKRVTENPELDMYPDELKIKLEEKNPSNTPEFKAGWKK